MTSATITSKGQITVPKRVRDFLGVEAGDRLAFEIREDRVVEIHPETVDLMSLYGSVRTQVRGVTLGDMDAAIRKQAAKKR